MSHRKQNSSAQISNAFIQNICILYGDCYDDRLEDSRPPAAGKKNGQIDKRQAGRDWEPGIPAAHKSLRAGPQFRIRVDHLTYPILVV